MIEIFDTRYGKFEYDSDVHFFSLINERFDSISGRNVFNYVGVKFGLLRLLVLSHVHDVDDRSMSYDDYVTAWLDFLRSPDSSRFKEDTL